MVGGGSGGHVTPLKAVAKAIKTRLDSTDIHVATDRRFASQAMHIFEDMPDVTMHTVLAGKLRRYNGKSLLWHLLHLPTLLKNIGDMFLILLGALQSLALIARIRPQVIFSKGGFVAVPVCVAAYLFRVPIVIHDSDAHPGLSSRIVSRWAKNIATGMPAELYPYPKEKTTYTGIPVDKSFAPTPASKRQQLKAELGFDEERPLLLVTGGGTGAERLNTSVGAVAHDLIDTHEWQIVQITGRGKSEGPLKARARLEDGIQGYWKIEEFVDLKPYICAADVVLSRTGATAMQEFANARKTVVTVPSRYLSGGHQLKNAQLFEQADAVRCIDEEKLEENPGLLVDVLSTALLDERGQGSSAKMLYDKFARPKAADALAQRILNVVSENARKK